jgi:hypothetical protein
MTLSIQLIDDSGEALIDSVIQGETNELRGELGRLFKGTEIFNISDLSPALQTEFVQQSANLTQRGAARAPRSRPDTTSTTSTTTATAGGKEEAPVYVSSYTIVLPFFLVFDVPLSLLLTYCSLLASLT